MSKDYEEALERAKKLHDGFEGYNANRHIIEEIFPELAESEDERIRKWISDRLLANYSKEDDKVKEALVWLEKQKDESKRQYDLGVQAGREEVLYEQQKPAEWSEEDDAFLDSILCSIGIADKQMNVHTYENKRQWLENRLKSLRPQPHWKPTEEQMKALKQIVEQFKPDYELESLYYDLLKSYS